MIRRRYRFPIKGSYFYSAQLAHQQRCLKVGSALYLTPEPDNAYDGNALQIWTQKPSEQGYLIGYVPRQLAKHWQTPFTQEYQLTLSHVLNKHKQLRLECDIELEHPWLKHLQLLSLTMWIRQQHALQRWFNRWLHR